MTEWGVFLALGLILSFVAGVVAPITKLTQSITRLTVVLDQVTKDVETLKKQGVEGNGKLWAHSDEQDARINDHETRLQLLEKTE